MPRPIVRIDCFACQSAGAAEGVVGSMEVVTQRAPWTKGRLNGQKRPLKPKDVWAIRVRLQLKHRERESIPLKSWTDHQPLWRGTWLPSPSGTPWVTTGWLAICRDTR